MRGSYFSPVEHSRVIALFLGAGSSISSGAPSTHGLANLITSRILLSDRQYDLADAVAYADGTSGRGAVAELLVKELRDLSPSESLKTLTRIPWSTIFTTTIDDLIEKEIIYETSQLPAAFS